MVKKLPSKKPPKKVPLWAPEHWLKRIGWTKTAFRNYKRQGALTYGDARRVLGRGW